MFDKFPKQEVAWVSALKLMVFFRPLMLSCLYFLHVLPVLSATHTHTHSLLHTCPLFSSQFDLLEWTTSHLWDDLLPVAAALLRAVVGGWVGDVVPEDVAAVGCKCNWHFSKLLLHPLHVGATWPSVLLRACICQLRKVSVLSPEAQGHVSSFLLCSFLLVS